MPISIEEFRTPSWVRSKERYPISENKKDKFNTICPRHDMARYNGDPATGWKQAGYNPAHNSKKVERIKVDTDNITLKPV